MPKSAPTSLIRSLIITLGLMPAYLILIMIGRYAINMPYWDEWYTVVYFWIHPDAPFWEYWKLYNGHRSIIPKLYGLLLSTVTHLNLTVFSYLALGIAVITFGLLCSLYCKRSTVSRSYWIAVPFGLLVFSLSQWPFWIIASSMPTALTSLCCVGAIWAITSLKVGWHAVLIAGVLAYIASLTLFTGNMVWLIILPLMWFCGYRKSVHYLTWVIMAASVLIPFAVEYILTTPRGSGFGSVSLIAHFVLAFIGSPLAFGESSPNGLSAAAPIGFIGLIAVPILAAAIFYLVEDGLRKMLPWLALSGWLVINAVFGALGRVAEFGPLLGRAYRYTPYGALYWIAVIALIGIALTEPRRDRLNLHVQQAALNVVPIGVALLIGSGYMNSVLAFTEGFDIFNQVLNKGYECLLTYETASDDCLKNVDPFPDYIRSVMPTLIEKHASFTRGMQFPIEKAQIDTPFKENTGYQTRSLDGNRTRILFQHPPSTLTWTLNLHTATNITFSTGIMVDTPTKFEADPSDGALFIIRVTGADGIPKKVFKRLALPRKPGQDFDPVMVDLTDYAGQTITITLETQFGLDDKATSNYDWAMWSLPELDYR